MTEFDEMVAGLDDPEPEVVPYCGHGLPDQGVVQRGTELFNFWMVDGEMVCLPYEPSK